MVVPCASFSTSGTIDADLAAMEEELAQLSATPVKAKGQAKRQPLPVNLPRTDIHHEPESSVCPCGCTMQRIGEDTSRAVPTGAGPTGCSLLNLMMRWRYYVRQCPKKPSGNSAAKIYLT